MDLTSLFQKKLLLVTGKGGVGKTMVAANLALEAARSGKKVFMIESTASDQIGPLLGVGAPGHQVFRVYENLYVANFNSDLNFRDFISIHLGFPGLFQKVFSKNIVKSFVKMVPGIAEITLLGQLYYYATMEKELQFDLIILDAYASGHFLSLLKTPQAILQAGFSGPIIEETLKIDALLQSSEQTGIVLVNNPEELIISETLDFLERLKGVSSLSPIGLFINRYEKPFSYEGYEGALYDLAYALHKKAKRVEKTTEAFLAQLQESGLYERGAVHLLPEWRTIKEPLTMVSAQNFFEEASTCHL